MKRAVLFCAAMIPALFSPVEAKSGPVNLTLPQLRKMMAQMEESKKPTRAMKGKTYSVPQDVLNAYVDGLIKEKGDGEIKDGSVRLEDRIVYFSALVDWKKISEDEKSKSWTKIVAAIAGPNGKSDAVIRASGSKGKAMAEVLSLKLNDMALPQPLIREMLESAGRKQKPPVDYFKPIDLPYQMKSLEIQKGRLLFSF